MNSSNSFRFILWALFLGLFFFLFTLWVIEYDYSKNDVNKNPSVVQNREGNIQETSFNNLGKKYLTTDGLYDRSYVIEVVTDLFLVTIDRRGGDIVTLKLLKYPNSLSEKTSAYTLLDITTTRFSIAQSGLIGEKGPDSVLKGRFEYKSEKESYVCKNLLDVFFIDLIYEDSNLVVTKRFYFFNTSYVINVEYIITNKNADDYVCYLFGRLKQKNLGVIHTWYEDLFSMRTFNGFAFSTDKKSFTKISFFDIEKNCLVTHSVYGWIASIERYFITSWIVSRSNYEYATENFSDGFYGIRFIKRDPLVIKPFTQNNINLTLYAGPAITKDLKSIAPGLDLTVDYGFFWFLSQPIFYLLSLINFVLKNWGFSIIFLTFFIRLLFFPLSASSYRSMAKLRLLQPKINSLKEKYKEDNKTQFSASLLELYKKENVNPFGGCLPLLIQIPVFIAFYYVLLQSVELRMVPFVFWINDLSVPDPYYVLPVLMGISMFIQQKLNPKPADPTQEKIFLFIPPLLTLLFLQFAAGLVLYWLVNNLLSITQQWYMIRKYT